MGDPDSSLTIAILSSADVTYTLYLAIPLAFVAAENVGAIAFTSQVTRTGDPDKSEWRLGSARGVSLKAGVAFTLTLSGIVAASPGAQIITVKWMRGLNPVGAADAAPAVTVLSAGDLPKILSFSAQQNVLTWDKSFGAPPINLKWETDPGASVTLSRLGISLLDNAPSVQSDWWPDSTYQDRGLQPYELTATENNKSVSRWVFVRVQAPGWNKVLSDQGSPTLLLNQSDDNLYGVFVAGGEAAAYQINPNAPGKEDRFVCSVPAGMEKSPGVIFNNQIWLIGGSQIEPEICSKQVWSFDLINQQDPGRPVWVKRPDMPLLRRMGHACTIFQERIWVLGGVDDNGNTLTDVWSADLDGEWRQELSLTVPLCLHTAIAFTVLDGSNVERLWVYGGFDAPFGQPQTSLWFLTAGEVPPKWCPMPLPGQDIRQPYGSALCVVTQNAEKVLCGVGTFSMGTGVTTASMFTLTGIYFAPLHTDLAESNSISTYDGWLIKKQTNDVLASFRLSAVGFQSYIFATSLVYGANSNSLTYLVQQS